MSGAQIRKVAKKVVSLALRVSGIGAAGPHTLLQDQDALRGDFAGVDVTPMLLEWEDTLQSPAVPLDGGADAFSQLQRVPQRAVSLDIREPGYSFQHDMAFDSRRRFLTPMARDFHLLPIMRKPLEKPDKKAGCIGFFANDASNYYHWMCWTLPLYNLYREQGLLDKIDSFYVGHNSGNSYQSQTMDKLFPESKRISGPIMADRLIYAQLTTVTIMPKSFHQFVRSLYLTQEPGPPARRLYVARGATKRRRVVGEERLIGSLESKRFEICKMDGLSIEEQARLFSSAEIIIAPHGAALTNLIFAPAGCKVIEIFPAGYTKEYFYALADHSNASYAYYRAGAVSASTGARENELDIHLDVDDFLKRAYDHLQI